MLKKITAISLVASMGFLGGCATMSESECLNADWRLIGFEDGLNGYSMSRIGDHRSACAEYSIVPSQALYQKGFDEGLRQFCNPTNAYDYGKSGRTYNHQCPADLHNEFLKYYNQGQEYYAIEKSIRDNGFRITDAKKKIEKLEKKILDKEARIISDDSSAEERLRLVGDIKRHKEEIGHLRTAKTAYERKRAVKEEELSRLQAPAV